MFLLIYNKHNNQEMQSYGVLGWPLNDVLMTLSTSISLSIYNIPEEASWSTAAQEITILTPWLLCQCRYQQSTSRK